jgi:SAM-dependent methyltransferase
MKKKIPKELKDAIKIKHTPTYIRDIVKSDLKEGKMLQVGGSSSKMDSNSHKAAEKFWGFEYYNIDLRDDKQENTYVGNAENMPIEDNSFDFIFTSDTFEHLERPWVVAKEMMRVLKPGGCIGMITCFSWRYHESPIDYWRFTPHCLKFLFKDLEVIETNWDITNRRADRKKGFQGNGSCNDLVPEDYLGAWRENWRVFYIGRKI